MAAQAPVAQAQQQAKPMAPQALQTLAPAVVTAVQSTWRRGMHEAGSDLNNARTPDLQRGFSSVQNAVDRLLPYHVCNTYHMSAAHKRNRCSLTSRCRLHSLHKPTARPVGMCYFHRCFYRTCNVLYMPQVFLTEEPEEADWAEHGRSQKWCSWSEMFV